ncbi:MAG TPA: hypothetical protein VFN88_02435, partial [Caulobacteraceae bacterium]|nr:hypothetical protein [Caulobacteraceae bacterium]
MTAEALPAQAAIRDTNRASRRLLTGRILSYLALVIAVLLVLFPIYWMIATSLKVPKEIFRQPSLIPMAPTLNNYVTLLFEKDFLVAIKNSLIVATTVT